MTDPLNVSTIDAPFSRERSIELAGRLSITAKISKTDPEQWPNSIYENSAYATFIYHTDDSKMLLVSSGMNMPKFRQQPCKSLAEFHTKINKYLAK